MTRKLLLVDDDLGVRTTLSRLAGTSWKILGTGSGREALRLIKEERPRLVIMDLALPDMDGMVLLIAARKIDPQLIVLILTNDKNIQTAEQCIHLGAVEYINKPFEWTALKTKMQRILEGTHKAAGPYRPWRVVR